MNGTEKSKDLLYQCKICKAPAIHSNYGVISCPPCKMFFKRNAEIGQGKLQCDFDGQCQINIKNRHMCSSCRLEKCFTSGMKTHFIRGSRFRKNSKRREKKVLTESGNSSTKKNEENRLYQLRIWNLLQVDQSILTTDQWKLFSNLMLCYDEQNAFSLAERFIAQQNILPIKLRFKYKSVHDFLSSLFAKGQFLFENNPDFHSLDPRDRSFLIHRQMKYLTIISSSFIAQQSHLFEYPAFNEAIETFFGRIVTNPNKLFRFDIPFLKLALAIISFSSFDYTINENLTNPKRILRIQDMYIELTWRYLVYVYDDKQAIICFSNFIRCISTAIGDVVLMKEKNNFMNLVNLVIEQTEQSFTVNSK